MASSCTTVIPRTNRLHQRRPRRSSLFLSADALFTKEQTYGDRLDPDIAVPFGLPLSLSSIFSSTVLVNLSATRNEARTEESQGEGRKPRFSTYTSVLSSHHLPHSWPFFLSFFTLQCISLSSLFCPFLSVRSLRFILARSFFPFISIWFYWSSFHFCFLVFLFCFCLFMFVCYFSFYFSLVYSFFSFFNSVRIFISHFCLFYLSFLFFFSPHLLILSIHY
ncbi:unnamed protein product [Acanthosepion pharaonis]|uniref:Transmembrane protein n=1 Tax=Acanthosepion pharaonis TaxID=158019 RepID=A0A812BR14_ACAPH|nr:unnamed protein product [Sepia pharaonis]